MMVQRRLRPFFGRARRLHGSRMPGTKGGEGGGRAGPPGGVAPRHAAQAAAATYRILPQARPDLCAAVHTGPQEGLPQQRPQQGHPCFLAACRGLAACSTGVPHICIIVLLPHTHMAHPYEPAQPLYIVVGFAAATYGISISWCGRTADSKGCLPLPTTASCFCPPPTRRPARRAVP